MQVRQTFVAESRQLTLRLGITAFPAGSPFLADRAVDIMIVRAGLAHGLEAPVSGRRPEQFCMLFVKFAEGGIGGFAAK